MTVKSLPQPTCKTSIITSSPVVWHDCRPSHNARPDWLVDAQAAADRARRAVDEHVESRDEQDCSDEYYRRLDDLTLAAEIAEENFADLWQLWSLGREPESLRQNVWDHTYSVPR